jgi:hypothetical protein
MVRKHSQTFLQYTHGGGGMSLSWMGIQVINARILMSVWHKKTTRNASPYEAIAASRIGGSREGIISVV